VSGAGSRCFWSSHSIGNSPSRTRWRRAAARRTSRRPTGIRTSPASALSRPIHRRTPVPGCRGDGHGSSRRRFRCRCRPCSIEVGKLTVIDDRNGGTLFGFDNADGNPWVVQQIRACRAAVDSGLTRSLSREFDCRTALLRLNWGATLFPPPPPASERMRRVTTPTTVCRLEHVLGPSDVRALRAVD
jgi:hypothetical protein